MPKVLTTMTVQKDETKEFISPEGVKFTVTNNSMGFKKVRLAFVYSKGRKKKGTPREQMMYEPEGDSAKS